MMIQSLRNGFLLLSTLSLFKKRILLHWPSKLMGRSTMFNPYQFGSLTNTFIDIVEKRKIIICTQEITRVKFKHYVQ
jgi:hypothetical protein